VNKYFMERKFHAPRMEDIVFYMVWSGQRGKFVKDEVVIKCDGEKVMMIMWGDDWESLSSSISDCVKHGEWIKDAWTPSNIALRIMAPQQQEGMWESRALRL
jgi:hypothetical protein